MLGVLFDFDGTLADTMQSHFEAWRMTLDKLGIEISENDYYPLEGMSMHSIARILSNEKILTDSEVNQLVEDKKNRFIASSKVVLYEGVESMIKKLKTKEIPMGIVTSSHAEQLFSKFNHSFLDQFQTIVTGDQVDRGKPDPQPYLIGAKMLGLNPTQCMAVENAPLGISSAKSAGMYCIAISSTVSPGKLSEADEIVPKIQDIESSIVFMGLHKKYERI